MNIETYLRETIEEAVRKVIREELEDFKEEILNSISPRSKYCNVTKDRNQLASKIIRPKELANMLSMSISTLYRMQHEDKLPPKVKMGSRAVGWLRSDIEEWLISRKQDE